MTNAVLVFDETKAHANWYAAQMPAGRAVVSMWWRQDRDWLRIFAEVRYSLVRTSGWVWADKARVSPPVLPS